MNTEEKIIFLEEYKSLVTKWDKERDLAVRPSINQKISTARKLIAESGCYKTLDISPPPAIGGYIMRNIDPLDAMFEPPYLMNLTTVVVDMIDQAIG